MFFCKPPKFHLEFIKLAQIMETKVSKIVWHKNPMEQYVESIEMCVWKIPTFVDENGDWFNNYGLGNK